MRISLQGCWDHWVNTTGVSEHMHFSLFKIEQTGAPGWLSRLSVQLLISAQVMIPRSWDQASQQALH